MEFIDAHLGEFAALLTAVFWAVSALAFETATLRLGSVAGEILYKQKVTIPEFTGALISVCGVALFFI
ncbi:MAG TPA: hypothetical protein DDW27_00655 [Bacteroidales bacterium]|nr:hypothetical protein [Bacteroidales bacterium]